MRLYSLTFCDVAVHVQNLKAWLPRRSCHCWKLQNGSDVIRNTGNLMKPNSGTWLVMLGVVTIFFMVVRGTVEVTTVTILIIGFGFLITFAGVVLIFKDLSKVIYSTSELDGEVDPSDIAHAVRQLGKNYDILRRKATQGFILSGIFMSLGILVILAGSLGEMLGFTQPL